MTLIRKSLYDEIINGRNERFAHLTAVTKDLESVTAELSVEQKWYDAYDKTTADLLASKEALEATAVRLEEAIRKAKEDIANTAETVDMKQTQKDEEADKLNNMKEKLVELEKEGVSKAEIDELKDAIDVQEGVVTIATQSFEKWAAKYDADKEKIKGYQVELDTTYAAITETKIQVSENSERYANAPGEIAEMTDHVDHLTRELADITEEYNSYLAKNKDTIKNYESQQLRRDANITKENTTAVYYRVQPDVDIVVQANDVMNEIVTDELKPANETESKLRQEWLDAGREKEINPYFLTANEAANVALGATWSTRLLAKSISEAAHNGEFNITVSALPNTIIYALQDAGYKVQMTEAELEKSEIIISWDNYSVS